MHKTDGSVPRRHFKLSNTADLKLPHVLLMRNMYPPDMPLAVLEDGAVLGEHPPGRHLLPLHHQLDVGRGREVIHLGWGQEWLVTTT